MNVYNRANGGYTGTAYDRWVEQRGNESNNKSTITKMQHHYWVTKQTVFRKLGKKEDDCIVASDAELDAKLELFRSIQDSCLDLQRIIDKYQERLCNLAQEENAMGRFLKESGKSDKTRAGKMMTAVGKSLSYSGQQRLTLRVPLLRLYQEVDTFRHRAIEDTLQNVSSMEKVRTEYRASLNWMKNVSQELDPDTYKQLERFRKVQGQVRRSKSRFDQLKLDCLQKVDLLAAARCNMFSHALILYQNSLLQFAEKTASTFTTIANSFKGYQHYDFCVVKELAEPSMKLAEQQQQEKGQEAPSETDKDKLLFFDAEYHDVETGTESAEAVKSEDASSLENLLTAPDQQPQLSDQLLEFNTDASPIQPAMAATLASEKSATTGLDLLTSSVDDFTLLNEILSSADTAGQSMGFGPQWEAVFGVENGNTEQEIDLVPQWAAVFGGGNDSGNSDQKTIAQDSASSFLPSQLLDQFTSLHTAPSTSGDGAESPFMMGLTATPQLQPQTAPASKSPTSTPARVNKDKDKRAAWFNLFADLDPLADPDAVGRTVPGAEDRNC
ncbi:Islet cell autoantigen 1 [Cryptotermes secundus]|uniref:Islet cell autoantigen 1 n=2 Tax=Cryptotermes secundus TaxID=105785 RepID=A0A2J7PQL6_9NEOP|nr:islet cell autoantigen 1 isoform X2 [Cryptotermes secundus]PNF18630.1 Islet cell autoantigen 1 [Cryptotermes secundus]